MLTNDRTFSAIKPEQFQSALDIIWHATKERGPLDDSPWHRANFAVLRQFKGETFMSIMMRMRGMWALVNNPKFKRWVIVGRDVTEVAEDLVSAFATAPLSIKRPFRVREVLRLAKEFESRGDDIDDTTTDQ